ncbi:MAG: hypothetical protein KL801_09410 [Mesorhizobium sp.]|nr:hypothetical protein [Mesorhizobium sp.]
MASILLGSFADDVTTALEAADVPYALTISRTETVPGPNPWDPPVETTTHYACRGWRDQYALEEIDGTLILSTDARVLILASSLSITPATTDLLDLDGSDHAIASIKRDPSGALWDLQVRA